MHHQWKCTGSAALDYFYEREREGGEGREMKHELQLGLK